MTRINKWLHVLIIQNHCGDVWEDESEYDDTPEGRKAAAPTLKSIASLVTPTA